MSDIQTIHLPLSAKQRESLRAGQQVLLSGSCYTLRDASIARLLDSPDDEAKRILELLKDQLIFFAGPTPAHPNAPKQPFGSIGPTTASRMDTAQIELMPQGMLTTLGKGARSKEYKQAAQKHEAIYFAAIGGAAAKLAQHVTKSKTIAWQELGTEAIMRLELKDFPVVVAIDTQGNDVYKYPHTSAYCTYTIASYAGKLITFEGGEGVGKSTQIKLLAQTLEAAGHEVLTLREPGSSTISESIRDILLDADNKKLSPRAELLLYEAARAQLTEEVIKPALKSGTIVLCDRFFDSTTAYQGFGRTLDINEIKQLNLYATGGIVPNLSIVLDLPPQVGLARAAKTGTPDRLESENLDFHKKVREGFLAIAAAEPERVFILDASKCAEALAEEIKDILKQKHILD